MEKFSRVMRLEKREIMILALSALILAGFTLVYGNSHRTAVASAETRFVEHSASGLQLVPASCPSSAHYAGDCGWIPRCGPGGCIPCPSGTTAQGDWCVPPPPPLGYSQGSYDGGYSQGSYVPAQSYYQSYYQGAYCSAAYFCSGNDLYYKNASCTDAFVQHCTWGCSGGCLPPPPPTGNITATPTLVHSGDTSEIKWTTQYTASCTVAENNPEINDAWTGTSGTKTSSGLTQQTKYTLTCTGIDGSTFTDSVTVNIIPIWQEQ